MKNNTKEEIDIVGLLKTIWDSKSIIIASTSVFSIAAVIYSLSLTNIYESEALLSPVNQSGSNQSMGNVAGLANLAFCKKNTKVLEFKPVGGGMEFRNISKLAKLKHRQIILKPLVKSKILQNGILFCPISRIKNELKLLGLKNP